MLESIKPKINDIKADLTKTRNDYMQNTLTTLSSQKEVFKNSKDPKSRSVIYQDKLSTYIKQLDEVSAKYDEISKKDIITKEDIESFDALKKSAEETATAIKNMSNMDKGVSGTTAGKWIRNISQYLEKNPKITAEAKQKLTEYLNILKDNGANANIREISAGFYEITNAERMAGREGKNLFSIIKDKALYGFAAQLGTFFSFYDIIRYGRQAVETIVNLDTALVDLRKTTTMSASELNQFYDESSEKAKKVGVTTAELIQQAANWSRLGFSDKDSATEMAMLSSKFAAISPDLDLDTATDGLVSSMKAFDIEVSDVQRDIMDNINRIGNTAATSNGEIVDMLTRSSAAMAAANNTIEETIALESAAVEITRNAETTGTAFKTIAMRLRGYDEQTEELSEDLKSISGDITNLTRTAGHDGISIFTDENKTEYKSTYQILKEISEIWDELSDKKQAQLLEKLAGKRGGQVVAGLISNFDSVEKAMDNMTNAAGSSEDEMSIIEDSLTFKMNEFKTTWEDIVKGLIDRGDIGDIVDSLTKISEAIGTLTDKLGLLGTAVTAGMGALGATGKLGRVKCCPSLLEYA